MGRTDIPVVPGAVFPLVRTREEAQLWQERYGKVALRRRVGQPLVSRAVRGAACQEGAPTTKPSTEDAAHFLIRMVHKYPHEVTIYEGGPMTNTGAGLAHRSAICRNWRRNWCSWAAA